MPDLVKQSTPKINNRSNGRYKNLPEKIIELHNVTKIYEGGAGKFIALKGINLSVHQGDFVAIIGKSGSGKSTLLNMLTGIDRPTTGQVVINHTPVHRLSEGKMAVWRGHNVGVVFQFFQLLPTLTVIENIILPMDFCKKYSIKERKERALYLLEEVDLLDQARKLPSALSGGQQQRVAIARALANDPPILVADEPTGNLDSKTAISIFRLFFKLLDQGKTIIMVTHDHDIAKQVSRMIFLVDGQIYDDQMNKGATSFGINSNDQSEKSLVDKDENRDINIIPNGNVLVKSISQLPNDPASFSISSANIDTEEIKLRIQSIFQDRSNAAHRLQEEFSKASGNLPLMNALYEAVIVQVNFLSSQAEKEHRPEEVKVLWKIVMDATKSWANIESD